MQTDSTTTRSQSNKPKLQLVSNNPGLSPEPSKPKRKIKRPLILQAQDIARLTTDTAEAILGAVRVKEAELGRAGLPDYILRAEKVAIDMAHCGLEDNHVLAADMHKVTDSRSNEESGLLEQDKDFFNGRTVLNCCESPLCLTYVAKKRRKLRRRTIAAFEAYTLEKGEGYLFITLTATKMPELSKVDAVALHNAAFRRWQRFTFFKENIAGGSRSVETTMRADTPGYHVHSHLPVVLTPEAAELCSTKRGLWQFREALRESWTRAYMAECERRGLEAPEPDTREGTYIVDCRHLYSREDSRPETLEAGLLEAVKYALKAESVKNLLKNPEALLELAGNARRVREFELFGCIREAAKAAGVLSLDTGDVNVHLPAAQEPEPSPEEIALEKQRRREAMGRVIALAGLPEEANYKIGGDFEPFLAETLDGLERLWELEELRTQGRDWRLALGESWRRVWAVRGSRAEGLTLITAGVLVEAIKAELWEGYLAKPAKRAGRYEPYLTMTAAEYASHARFVWAQKQSYAHYRLTRRYPWAEFRTLAGETFEGIWREERLEEIRASSIVAA